MKFEQFWTRIRNIFEILYFIYFIIYW